MILLEGSLGSANLVFSHRVMLRKQVTLPMPVTKAKVLLRGFDMANGWGDRNLKTMKIRLDLGYGDGAHQLEVIAIVELTDKAPAGDAMQVEILYTVIGE